MQNEKEKREAQPLPATIVMYPSGTAGVAQGSHLSYNDKRIVMKHTGMYWQLITQELKKQTLHCLLRLTLLLYHDR